MTKRKLIFAGTPQNAADALSILAAKHEIVLVITREDAIVGRSKELQQSAVAKTASHLGIPIHKTNRFDSQTLQRVAEAEAELAVVIAFGAMIPEAARSKLPWWNVHFSLLPKWRGASPLQQSMIHDDGVGVSVFEIDRGLDTGPIIGQRALVIEPRETYGQALNRFTIEGMNLLLKCLEDLSEPRAQQGEVSFAPKISRADAKLDFSLNAVDVERIVRAFNPEPVAWAEYGDLQLRILSGLSIGNIDWSSLDGSDFTPGLVLVEADRVLVCCGEGTRYELLEVQPSGKRIMKAIDWARGLRTEVRFV